MSQAKITRTATIYQSSDPDKKMATITTDDSDLNHTITLQLYSNTGIPIPNGWLKCNREKFLDLFVELWPDDVAYRFKSTDAAND